MSATKMPKASVCLLHSAVLSLIIHFYQIKQPKQWENRSSVTLRGAVVIQLGSRWRHRTTHPRQDSPVSVNARDDYLSEQGMAGSSFVFFVCVFFFLFF